MIIINDYVFTPINHIYTTIQEGLKKLFHTLGLDKIFASLGNLFSKSNAEKPLSSRSWG